MQLNIVNLTGSTRTYLSGAISVAGNSTTGVTSTVQQLSLSTDGQLHSDILNVLVQLSDGVNNYGNLDAIAYLTTLIKVIGPNSDAVGNNITSTLIGSKQSLDINAANISGPVTAGTVANNSALIGGQYNSSLPTLSTGQQAALQSDSNGRLLIGSVGNITGTISLPTGAATSSLQTTANTYLSEIVTNTGASATDFTTVGTISALNGTVSVYGQGVYTVSASITGTWVGTLVAEGQLADNTWVQIPVYTIQSSSLPYLVSFSLTANASILITGGSYLNIRIRASAYTSGTVNIALDGSLAQQTIFAAQLGQWNMSGSATTTSGSIAGNGNILQLPAGTGLTSLTPYSGVLLEISGTWNSTLTLTGSNGNTYYTIDVLNLSNPNTGPQSTITANGLYYAPLSCVSLELVSSGYVSGTVLCYASFRAIPPPMLSPAVVTAKLEDGSGNAITSTNSGGKQYLDVKDPADGAVTPGTVASFSSLIGGQYNSPLPTLTTTQQSAVQVDSRGRVITAPVSLSYFHPIYFSKIQNVTAATAGAVASLTATIAATKAGSLLVITAASQTDTMTITDSASQSYSTATTQTSGNDHLYVFYKANTVAGVTSVTITPSANDRMVISVTEYPYVDATTPLDKSASNSQAAVTSWSSTATATTTVPVELLIGSALDFVHTTAVFTAGTGWTSTATVNNTGGGSTLTAFQEEQIVASTGAYAASGTNSISATILSAISTFKISSPPTGLTVLNSATSIKSTPGTLAQIVVNTAGTGSASATFYDNTTNSGTVVATLSLTSVGTYTYGLHFATGLTMVLNSTTADFTVIYD